MVDAKGDNPKKRETLTNAEKAFLATPPTQSTKGQAVTEPTPAPVPTVEPERMAFASPSPRGRTTSLATPASPSHVVKKPRGTPRTAKYPALALPPSGESTENAHGTQDNLFVPYGEKT